MRRPRHEESANHERWAIPYADLLTLLLALFVVMYALSVVNVSKYRALASSLHAAFNGRDARVRPAAMNSAPAAGEVSPVPSPHADTSATPVHTDSVAPASNASSALGDIMRRVHAAMGPLMARHMIELHRSRYWLEIDIRTDLLFDSGSAQLQPRAGHVLKQVAAALAPFTNPLRVEGYTDDEPIHTQVYPSNWELSAARAANVARLFAENGIDPSRLGILGWGQYRPIADNDSAQGRKRNRRVSIVVLSAGEGPARFYTDARHVPSRPAAAASASAETEAH